MTISKRRRAKAPNNTTQRSAAHLGRLAEGGGKPIRVDTSGEDLKLMEELIAEDYADNTRAHRKTQAKGEAKKLTNCTYGRDVFYFTASFVAISRAR